MGQKSNPISLRSNLKKNTSTSKYIVNNSKDSSIFLIQDLNLRNYLTRFFETQGFLLYKCDIYRTPNLIKFFISYFFTPKSTKLFKVRKRKTKKNFSKKKRLKKKFFLKKIRIPRKFIRNPISFFKFNIFKRSILILNRKIYFTFKRLKKKSIIEKKNFINKLTSCINLFYDKKYNIKIILQNTNKGLSNRLKNKESYFLRKLLSKFRFYSKFDFFLESVNLVLHVIRLNYSSKILTNFISLKLSTLKKHNFFLTFLRRLLSNFAKSRISKINGIKVTIKGRFNGSSRARSRTFMINSMPLQTFNNSIDISQSESFTNNGTFGVTVCISR